MRTLALAAFSLTTLSAAAQDMNFPIYAGFSVQAGGAAYPGVGLGSYTHFRESYNDFYASGLKAPLGDLAPSSSYSYGGGGYIGPIYFTVVQHHTTAEASAVFTNGSRREVKLDFHPLDANFDLMFPTGKRLWLGMALGLQLQKARIYSGIRYPGQDVLSYAEDNALNGIYDFFSTSTINIGVRTDIKLVKRKGKSLVNLSLRGERMGAFKKLLGSESTDKLLPHRDEMTVAATGGYLYDDGTLHKYMVEDAENMNNDYVYFVGTGGGTLHSLYSGWRVSASVILTLFEWELN